MAQKHFGIYRDVTLEQMGLDCKILRILYQGSLVESVLQRRSKCTMEELRESLARLEEWRLVEVLPPHWGTARKVVLCLGGMQWAEELTAQRQTAGDHTKE